MGWQVALSEQAEEDLEAVVAFIARKSAAAAERTGLELVALIFALDQLPNRGTSVKKRPGAAQDRASALPRHLPRKRAPEPRGSGPRLGWPSGPGKAPAPLKNAALLLLP